MRLLTLARALWNQDAHGLQQLRRHWAQFAHIARDGDDGYELAGRARFEAALMTTQRARRSRRAARRGEGGTRSVAKRARAGSRRDASLWRARRPMLRF